MSTAPPPSPAGLCVCGCVCISVRMDLHDVYAHVLLPTYDLRPTVLIFSPLSDTGLPPGACWGLENANQNKTDDTTICIKTLLPMLQI